MSGSIVIASFGDGLPRGIQSILLQYDSARRKHRMARSARSAPGDAPLGNWPEAGYDNPVSSAYISAYGPPGLRRTPRFLRTPHDSPLDRRHITHHSRRAR